MGCNMQTKFTYAEEYKKAFAEKLAAHGEKALSAAEFYSAWDLGFIGNKGCGVSEADQNEKLQERLAKIEKSFEKTRKKARIKSIYLLNATPRQIAEYYKVSTCFVSKIKAGRVGKEITKDLIKNSLDFDEFVKLDSLDKEVENASE